MRPFFALVTIFMPAALAAAEPAAVAKDAPFGEKADFQLGGAASRIVMEPASFSDPTPPAPRLSLPQSTSDPSVTRREASLGAATLFLGEGLDAGRDAVHMGTFLSSGQARAGVSITYLEREEEVSRSEVFVNYALSNQFSVGLSGILNSEIGIDEPVPQLGLSAEYSTSGGAFLQGGVADAAEFNPIIGVSIGLRF